MQTDTQYEFTFTKVMFKNIGAFQNEHQHEGVEMGSESELRWVSQLLQLSEDWLNQALTMKVTVRWFLFIFTSITL